MACLAFENRMDGHALTCPVLCRRCSLELRDLAVLNRNHAVIARRLDEILAHRQYDLALLVRVAAEHAVRLRLVIYLIGCADRDVECAKADAGVLALFDRHALELDVPDFQVVAPGSHMCRRAAVPRLDML